MAYRYVASALAFASLALADCNVSGTATIQNAGDATAFATCSTITGSIAIATGTSDPINIPNVKAITGDLSVMNAPNITSLSADTLQTIGGTFNLNNCQILSSVTMPYLTQVNIVQFNALPNLQGLGFTSNVKQASTLNIQNTFLTSLNGINLQNVNTVVIANNKLLQDISFQVSNIAGAANFEYNGDKLSVALPNLQTAQNLTFRDCNTISIPSLANVTGVLGFYENTITSLSAPNLTLVSQTLAIDGNNLLTNLTMPALTTIGGGFQIQNNTDLTDLSSSFNSLATIGGALDFEGAFTSVKLPGLKDNKGAFTVISSNDITNDCNTFKAESGPSNVIKGTIICKPKTASTGTSTNGTTSSTTSKSAAANSRLDVSSNAAIGFGSVIIAMFGLL